MTDDPRAPPTPPDCLLTLSVPRALEEELIDSLMAYPALAAGFTLWPGQGMGTGVELTSAMEQVRGRAGRVVIQVALPRARLSALVETLVAQFGNAGITYWAAPLLAFGRLGVST